MTLQLEDAKNRFTDLMRNLNKRDQEQFLLFIVQEWRPMENIVQPRSDNISTNADDEPMDDPAFLLNSIAYDIRKRVPFSGILPTEHIEQPIRGENSDCEPDITVHVDEFLYDDDDMNELIDDGKLKKYYCANCGSHNMKHLIFISHSMSRDALYFIFNTLLPTIKGKTLLDIGSRLGAVLYGAYVYTDAAKIIGVEMNEQFCNLQRDIVKQFKMSDKIEILHEKIEDMPEVVSSSDVLVLNNPFEFYLSEQQQIDIWRFLKYYIKKGAFLVTRPSVEKMLQNLDTGIIINEWLKPLPSYQSSNQEFSSLSSVTSKDGRKYDDIVGYEII